MGLTHLHKKTGFVILPDRANKGRGKYSTFVDRNGVIQVVPRRRNESTLLGLIKIVVICLAMLTAFKTMTLISSGTAGYSDRLSGLSDGTLPERVGAWLLQVDPATTWIAQTVQALFN